MIRQFLASLVAALLLSPLVHAAELDRIVAVVNNEAITLTELKARVQMAARELQRQGTAPPQQGQFSKQVLDRMVMERLQLQWAQNASVQVDDATLERALQRIADNNRLDATAFRKAVEAEGLTWQQFRENIRNEIILARLREREVDSRVVVSDAEVEALLASAEGSASGREYLVSHILLRAPEGASPEQWKLLEQRAAEVMQLVQQGEDFAKLAATFSSSRDAMQGGSLDWRPAGRLPALFAHEVVDMSKGQVGKILRSAAGLHIFKLVDVRDTAPTVVTVQQTHARHILLRANDMLSDAEARRRLNDLRERIRGGTDFAELARVHSSDGTAPKGGDLGWLSPGETVPEFERAMDALTPGEISAPVQSPFGWHLIQVLERRTADVTNERRKLEARQALRERKGDEAYEDWLRQLRDTAYVEYKID